MLVLVKMASKTVTRSIGLLYTLLSRLSTHFWINGKGSLGLNTHLQRLPFSYFFCVYYCFFNFFVTFHGLLARSVSQLPVFTVEKCLLYIFGVLSVSLDLLVPAPLWRIRKVYLQGSTVRHFVLVTNQNSSFSKGIRLHYLLRTCLLTKLGYNFHRLVYLLSKTIYIAATVVFF